MKICPKCGGIYIRYKRSIDNPFGPGKWTCFKCYYNGTFPDVERAEIEEFRKKIKEK